MLTNILQATGFTVTILTNTTPAHVERLDDRTPKTIYHADFHGHIIPATTNIIYIATATNPPPISTFVSNTVHTLAAQGTICGILGHCWQQPDLSLMQNAIYYKNPTRRDTVNGYSKFEWKQLHQTATP